MFALYNRLNLDRVYFSSYQKGLGHPDIPGEKTINSNPENSFVREHRLYQVDFLIRKYGFRSQDIILDENGNLKLDKDPKEIWADKHPEFFPVKINKSDREALLRVPGLGLDSVGKILAVRRKGKILRIERFGIKGKRLEKIKKYVVLE